MSQYQQEQYQQEQFQPMSQPPKKRGKFFAIGCGSLVVLFVLIGIIVAASSGNSSPQTDSTATQSAQNNADYGTASAQLTAYANTPAAPTEQATQVPTTALTWKTTQTITGNGEKKTAIFTAPDDWKILWSCTGGDFGGYLGVTVYDSKAAYVDGAVNATCKTGSTPTTGETEEHQGGQVYLDVNGTGDWTLTIQELK
jgi:hypothetical protein